MGPGRSRACRSLDTDLGGATGRVGILGTHLGGAAVVIFSPVRADLGFRRAAG